MKCGKYVLFGVAVFLSASVCAAQSTETIGVNGYVFNAKSLRPIKNASVGVVQVTDGSEVR